MSDLDIQLLGALEVRRGAQLLHLPGRRLRTLLVVLSLEAARNVTVEALTQAMWDADPPAHARASLQSLVARLRRAIGDDVIETTTAGYRLTVARSAVDVLRFRDAVSAASAKADPTQERNSLTAALADHGGEPFGEPLSDWLARYEAPRLTEEYLAALERRLELDLATGRAEQVVGELLSLTGAHPLREPLWERLLVALREAGRTAEALQAYDRLRTHLAEELGADPGAELQQLHRDLLKGTDAPPAPPIQGRQPPRQLPRAPGRFVGRGAELRQLDHALAAADQTSVLVLHGTSGVGKTALGLCWADSVASYFPDGQLFIDLHGFDQHTVAPLAALETLLRSLGVSNAELPRQEQAAAALFRSIMAERNCLLVLDNACDPAQVRPLLPGGQSLVLITTRSQMRSLAAREGAHRIAVDLLPEPEAVAMLATRTQQAATGSEELSELAALCGYLPIALSVVAERLARDSATLHEVVIHLRDETRRLDALTTGDDPLTDVRAAFNGSYAQLDAQTASGFRLLALHPETTINGEAVAALLGSDLAQARQLLDRLVGWHLLEAAGEDWYDMHDLVRAFARDRMLTQEPEDSRAAARSRLRTWYAHTVFAATYSDDSSAIVDLPDLPAHTRPRSFPGRDEAMSWLAAHRPAITRLIRTAAVERDGVIASRLANDFTIYLSNICADAEEREICRIGVAAARAVGAASYEAACLNRLGMRLAHDEEYVESIESFLRGARLFASIDEPIGEQRLAGNAAVVHCLAGRPEQAEELLLRYVADLELRDLVEELAPTLNQLAGVQLALDRPRDAVTTATRVVQMLAPGTRTRVLAIALHKIAEGCAALGDLDGATAALSRTAGAYESVGDLNEAVQAWEYLGLLQRDHGRPGAAARSWSTALELLDGADAAAIGDRREKLRSLLAQADHVVS